MYLLVIKKCFLFVVSRFTKVFKGALTTEEEEDEIEFNIHRLRKYLKTGRLKNSGLAPR